MDRAGQPVIHQTGQAVPVVLKRQMCLTSPEPGREVPPIEMYKRQIYGVLIVFDFPLKANLPDQSVLLTSDS